ncbi:hypothetical protein PAXRUDRAFT_827858 [Paxillus rubicundulus Ve08.2h10]|uniref:Uncharacterized protein n=1 Tax=Paxillus rubicundulus Ve08.2h10 TaxID=930991 RepID=A0A0D0E258_9AGAM|nr:hypothetical protein PAXRUDRAFT_827858 [Paxillus rubicundulus Ve08.2h10]
MSIQASTTYPTSPPSSYQQLSSPATSRTPSCSSPASKPTELISQSSTPTQPTPSTATYSPRQRIYTPSNKLTPPSHTQPTLAMSIVAPIPRRPHPTSPHQVTPTPSMSRPHSRSERLLRDTLRKDETLRTTATVRARSRSPSSPSDGGDDEFFVQPALLFRGLPRRNSATSTTSHPRPRGSGACVLGNGHAKSFYVPNENEHTSYTQLLRSTSFSSSSRSGRPERKSSQPITFVQEKQEDPGLSRSYDAAPHEAVLRTRLDRVIHRGMHQVRREREAGTSSIESSTGSPPSSLCSLSNSRSHESEQTQLTVPEVDVCLPSTPPPRVKVISKNGHRPTRSMSAAQSPHHTLTSSPKAQPWSPLTPQIPWSPPQTPRSQEQLKQKHSPWLSSPLPSSPPPFATTPPKRAGPGVATVASSHSTLIYETNIHTPSPPHLPHSPHSSPTFDPEAASLACRQVPGYVSFASVAGLGAPPEEEDRRSGRKGFAGFGLGGGGKGRGLTGLVVGSGKWWVF